MERGYKASDWCVNQVLLDHSRGDHIQAGGEHSQGVHIREFKHKHIGFAARRSQGEITPRQGESTPRLGSVSTGTQVLLPEEGSSCSLQSYQCASPDGQASSSIEADNPFAETFPPGDVRGGVRDPDDLSLLNSPCLSAFFGDEPRTASLPSQPWRMPPALARKHSLPQLGYESSPLRWSYSSVSRNERTAAAAADKCDAFLPTQHRLSVSSVSLESLPRSCVTPRPSPPGSAANGDSPISASNLRILSSHQAARILKAEVGSVDAYVN